MVRRVVDLRKTATRRNYPLPKKRALGAFGASVAFIVLGVVLCLRSVENHPRKTLGGNSPSARVRAFGFLGGPPEPLSHRIGNHVASALGLRPSSLGLNTAQYVGVHGGGIWLVSLRDANVMCAIDAVGWAVTCDEAPNVIARGLALGLFRAPTSPTKAPISFRLVGIAPDWAIAARVKVREQTFSIPIQRNGYSIRTQSPATLVGLLGRHHRWHI